MADYVQNAGGSNQGKRYMMPAVACDICGKTDLDEFVDGATVHGPWAIMCKPCHSIYGRGLGVGRGQEYIRVVGTDYVTNEEDDDEY